MVFITSLSIVREYSCTARVCASSTKRTVSGSGVKNILLFRLSAPSLKSYHFAMVLSHFIIVVDNLVITVK